LVLTALCQNIHIAISPGPRIFTAPTHVLALASLFALPIVPAADQANVLRRAEREARAVSREILRPGAGIDAALGILAGEINELRDRGLSAASFLIFFFLLL
jgi:hypothetical protein